MATFDDYIAATGIVIIEVIIRNNSKITIPRALDLVRSRVNRNANLDTFADLDVKLKLSDLRNGNIYEVFSDKWMEKYNQTNWWGLQYDNVSVTEVLNRPIIDSSNMHTDELLITSLDGLITVPVDNPNNDPYNLFIKTLYGPNVRIDVLEESDKYFTLSVIDTDSFIEGPKDCSSDNITVNYVIIFE